MPRLELAPGEAKELQRVLKSYLSDLRMEIAGTDSFDFRRTLKRTEALLKRIIGRLQGRSAGTAPRARKRSCLPYRGVAPAGARTRPGSQKNL